MTPLVSVLLPARNASSTIERAVRSILLQSLGGFELIAVDDGSTDGTPALLSALAQVDRRVRVLTGEGRGLVRALKRGLAACRGRYIARMDADDESLPERLEMSVAALDADPTLAAVGTQVEMVRSDRPVSPNMHAYAQWLNSLTTPRAVFENRFVESPLCHPATTLRREALDAVGDWDEGDFAEDYQLWLKLLSKGFSLANVPRVLFRWSDGEERLTRTDARYGMDCLVKLKARYLAQGLGRGGCLIWGAGRTGKALARALRREGTPVSGFIEVDPKRIGNRIDGAPVRPVESLGPPEEHLIAAVGAKGARKEIRDHLRSLGWRETEHFTCAA